MKIVKVIQGDFDAFFEILFKSIQKDIYENIGIMVETDILETGFEYEKKIHSSLAGRVQVLVTLLPIKNKVFQVHYKDSKGTTIQKYCVKSINENSFELVYLEEFIYDETRGSFCSKILNYWLKKRKKRLAEQQLNLIEKLINNQS